MLLKVMMVKNLQLYSLHKFLKLYITSSPTKTSTWFCM